MWRQGIAEGDRDMPPEDNHVSLQTVLSEIHALRADIALTIRELRDEKREDLSRVHQRVDSLDRNGCAHLTTHFETQKDNAGRIRTLEDYKARQIGAAAALGSVTGAISGVLVVFGRVIGKTFLDRLVAGGSTP